MAKVQTITLELLRPGPAHNQLLSRLTPYIAICGEAGPVTFHLDFEHRELLNHLARLRYISVDPDGQITPVSAQMREAELAEIGALLGRILAAIPSLNSELNRSIGSKAELIHLRLVIWGSELSFLPLELAAAPKSFPGHGKPLLLQSYPPVVLTREVRRGQPMELAWNRTPKILFAWAQPKRYTAIPWQAHLQRLRLAIEPFPGLEGQSGWYD